MCVQTKILFKIFWFLSIVFTAINPSKTWVSSFVSKFVENLLKISVNNVDLFNCSQQLGPSSSWITMCTTYLRQELTKEDLVKTLAELGLALSSTLIVAVVSLRSILGCFLKHSSIEKSEYLSHVNLAHGLAYQWVLFNPLAPRGDGLVTSP